MTIDALTLKYPERRRIAWLGDSPPTVGRVAFTERRFLLEEQPCTDAQLQDQAYLAGLAGVIFIQDEKRLKGITEDLARYAKTLLNLDCIVIVICVDIATSEGRSQVVCEIDRLKLWATGLLKEEATQLTTSKELIRWMNASSGEPPLPHVRISSNSVSSWITIANFFMEHPPGPAPNSALRITIEGAQVEQELEADQILLLRRAFYDCEEVHLRPMREGSQSGASVYCGYAELSAGQHGRCPLPYFVKLGDRGTIFQEYLNYEDHVDPYVPFHLGPHLIRERCCLGADNGVIVGDFVDESESLIDCAHGGRAGPAIACLFERTLRGWYRSAKDIHEESIQLGKQLLSWFPRPRKMSKTRFSSAKDLFGATKDLKQLLTLFEQCTSTPVLVGPIHGDLKAANVLVRATDAIVIDFCAHKQRGPLLYDAAFLEASLLVDGFSKSKLSVSEWFKSVETLYDDVSLQTIQPDPKPNNPASWFHTCVRQIRLYARQMQTGNKQYAAVLALALLKKAVKDWKAPEPEASRRAAAYALAERVLSKSFSTAEKEQ